MEEYDSIFTSCRGFESSCFLSFSPSVENSTEWEVLSEWEVSKCTFRHSQDIFFKEFENKVVKSHLRGRYYYVRIRLGQMDAPFRCISLLSTPNIPLWSIFFYSCSLLLNRWFQWNHQGWANPARLDSSRATSLRPQQLELKTSLNGGNFWVIWSIFMTWKDTSPFDTHVRCGLKNGAAARMCVRVLFNHSPAAPFHL